MKIKSFNSLHFIALIATFSLIHAGCSKECNIKDFEGIYSVDSDDKACFVPLIESEVKYAVFNDLIPFIIINDRNQFQLALATTEDPGGGCGFTFVAPNFPPGESATVSISGKNLVITYRKSGSICEAKLSKK